MKTSDLLIKCLENEGVKYIFALPGEEIEDLLFSLENSSIQLVTTRHEQGAAFMAYVWGRLTGKAGVCMATLGPGATNLITGLAEASLDKSPVVAITGQADTKRLHKESHQVVDIVNMFRPIVKWNASIQTPSIVPEVVRKAFKLAQSEKPGVTHVEIPEDIAKMANNLLPLTVHSVRPSAPDHKAIKDAMELLQKSKKPIILVGNGAIRSLDSKQLTQFVHQTHIPFVTTFMGKGAISDKNLYSLYSIGLEGKDFQYYAMKEADLIIAVGYDIAEYDPAIWNHDKKSIIHIDFVQSEVDEYYNPEIEIIADISASILQLNREVKKEKISFDTKWFVKIREAIEKEHASYDIQKIGKITVPGVLRILRKIMADDGIVISDIGAHKMWIARTFPTYVSDGCIIPNGLSSMGVSVPAGIAAKLAFPNRQVIAITGDGGFLMNSQEIETAKRMKIGYVILVLTDNDYGLISWKQKNHMKRAFGTTIGNPDFVQYANSFGIKAYNPSTYDDIVTILKKTVESGELALVSITVDAIVNLQLSEKLKKGIYSP